MNTITHPLNANTSSAPALNTSRVLSVLRAIVLAPMDYLEMLGAARDAQVLLERAATYEARQPSYAADLRAAALRTLTSDGSSTAKSGRTHG
jgi:hypothetical protein